MQSQTGLLRWCLKVAFVLVPILLLIIVGFQMYINPSTDSAARETDNVVSKRSAGTCSVKKVCPEDQFSFYIQSGAANAVGPKICVQNNLILGTILNNVGVGINIVTINGKTGEILKKGHFDMYAGEVEPLIEFLKSIETGSVVLVASFDEPASKLNDEARQLIAELGSSSIKLVGFRDSWVFVGAKGLTMKSNFEKYIKNDQSKNKYENWPEMLDVDGCIPKLLE
ncbi:protein FAM3C isoform 1-T3 [Odontesthes bonariensis]|uniref:protein FAM3C n=1 Tax=Odontesthes bonariensis TaxID=219752 RepID=UPI003F5838A5